MMIHFFATGSASHHHQNISATLMPDARCRVSHPQDVFQRKGFDESEQVIAEGRGFQLAPGSFRHALACTKKVLGYRLSLNAPVRMLAAHRFSSRSTELNQWSASKSVSIEQPKSAMETLVPRQKREHNAQMAWPAFMISLYWRHMVHHCYPISIEHYYITSLSPLINSTVSWTYPIFG